MSIKIMSKVWQTPCGTHTQKLVLLALADNANDEGDCWPSIGTIARKCDLTETSVSEQIQKLSTFLGLVKVIREIGKVNRYRIILPPNAIDPPTPYGWTPQRG